MNRRRYALLWLLAFVLVLAMAPPRATGAWGQYNSVLKSPGAAEQLRLGVQSYQRGRYAESILLFEKALAYDPGEPLIEYWLGGPISRADTRKRRSASGSPSSTRPTLRCSSRPRPTSSGGPGP